mgnify:CR=1 FL=1
MTGYQSGDFARKLPGKKYYTADRDILWDLRDDNFLFFNPKAGLTYQVASGQKIYFSYAKAQREPNRTDYENGTPKPEKLDDF